MVELTGAKARSRTARATMNLKQATELTHHHFQELGIEFGYRKCQRIARAYLKSIPVSEAVDSLDYNPLTYADPTGLKAYLNLMAEQAA